MNTQVVLITGALTGIGRAAAIAFAQDGAHVVVSGRRDKEGQELAAELQALGAEASLSVVTSATKMMCGIWWIGPSRVLAVWMLLSIALELRASLAR